jgi:hypothetical protein
MKDQLTRTGDDIRKSAGENITFAEASVIPSSPNPPLIIGFALLGGLGVGIGLALWLERRPQQRHAQKSETAGSSQTPTVVFQAPGAPRRSFASNEQGA